MVSNINLHHYIKGAFEQLLAELKGPALKKALEKAFGLSLANTFTRVSLRGFSTEKDGELHRDDVTKKVSVLVSN